MPANDDPFDSFPGDDRSEGGTGAIARLVRLLRTLADADTDGTQRRTGHVSTDRTRVDYEYSVSVGLDVLDGDDGVFSDEGKPTADNVDRATDTTPSRSVEVRDVSETERVVIADLPRVSDTEFDVTFDAEAGELTIWRGQTQIRQVPIEHPSMKVTDVSFNNHILRVELRDEGTTDDGANHE
ncbi:gas vesicle protein GvpH [Halorubrum sp. RMP-47]|uniref:Gas vesicle protein GvpH n=1 Tax=Halorubrum miltondacostae TaxID=3076378 RepID=A0ABD5M4J7_9EURY